MYRHLQKCLYKGLCPKLSTNSLACKMYVIVNKQVKFLTSQYIGICKSAYTRSYVLN